jgi:hypothetical protein
MPWDFDFWKCFIVLSIISLSFLCIGFISKQVPNRVLFIVLIWGFVGLFPILLSTIIFSTGFAFGLSSTSRFIYLLILMIVTLAWCTYQLRGYRKRIVERRFMEKEFFIDEKQISMRTPSKISLDAPPLTDKTLLGRLFYKVGPYLFLLIPFAYPLQKLVGDISGFFGVSVLLAVLFTPLAIHILGRLTCGIYLYVYKIWQLEHKYGKPVMFSPDD